MSTTGLSDMINMCIYIVNIYNEKIDRNVVDMLSIALEAEV